jgi:hypothetical protein
MRDIMLYGYQMPYLIYENDKKQADTFKLAKFVKLHDFTTNEKLLHVMFSIQDDAVRMKTSQPLTYIYAGNTRSMSIGDQVTIPLDHDVVLCSASVTMPHIKMRVVKLDDPRAPTPPPEGTARLVKTLSPTPPPEDRFRATTLPYDDLVPAPPPPQAQKRQKRQKRQPFHMVA